MGPSVSISGDLRKKQELRREQKDMRYRSADTHIYTETKKALNASDSRNLPIESQKYLEEVARDAHPEGDPYRPPMNIKNQSDSSGRKDFIVSSPTGPSPDYSVEDLNSQEQRQTSRKSPFKKRIHTRQRRKNGFPKGDQPPYQIQGKYMEDMVQGEEKTRKQDEYAIETPTQLKPANSNIEPYGNYAEQQIKEKVTKQKYQDQNGPVLEEYWPRQKRQVNMRANQPQIVYEGQESRSGRLRRNRSHRRDMKREKSSKGIEVLSLNSREKDEDARKDRVARRR